MKRKVYKKIVSYYGISKVFAMLMAGFLLVASLGYTNTTYAETGIVTSYAAPSSLPSIYKSSDFTVTAGGKTVSIYNGGANAWGNNVSYGYFDFSGGSITVSITVNSSFSTFKLVPASLGITGTKSGNTITFSISNPTNISLVLDDNYQGKVLHLFAEALETDIPSPTDPNVIYYGPGYYDLSAQAPTKITSGKTLYIAGGAVIRGRFTIENASNVTVRGRGILLNDYLSNDNYNSVPLVLGRSSNVTIRDIILNRNANAWTAFMCESDHINVINYKAVSPKYASTDGFNISNSNNVTFDKVFIHSADDSVAIKGAPINGYNPTADPSTAPPNYKIVYKNSQLWSDANNAIGIGAETQAQYFDNITFDNIDILYSFDDHDNPDVLTDRSAINIYAVSGTQFTNITFSNIRVEKAKRLINIEMHDSFWFNTLKGSWQWPGSMSGITYNNITSTSNGSNQIRVIGWDSTHQISNVNFNNININGSYLTSFNDPRIKVNQFANSLHINYPNNPTVNLEQGPIGLGKVYNASTGFTTSQGGNNWYYRSWAAGIGTSNMTWNRDGSNHWRGPNTSDAIWNGNGNVYLHPDNNQAILEWQAPMAGTVYIAGTVKKGDTGGGDGVNVSIWKVIGSNGSMIWPYDGSNWKSIAYNNTTGYSHNFSVNVAAGDIISFRVDQKSNNGYDTTSWNPVITYQ